MANYWECKLEAALVVLDALVNEGGDDFNWHEVLAVPQEGDSIECTADHSTGRQTPDGKPILSACPVTRTVRVNPVTLEYEFTKNPSPTLDDWWECHAGHGPAHDELYRRDGHVSFSSRGGVLAKNFLVKLSQQFPDQAITFKACDPATTSGWVIEVRAGCVTHEWETAPWETTTDPCYKVLEAELCGFTEGSSFDS